MVSRLKTYEGHCRRYLGLKSVAVRFWPRVFSEQRRGACIRCTERFKLPVHHIQSRVSNTRQGCQLPLLTSESSGPSSKTEGPKQQVNTAPIPAPVKAAVETVEQVC